MMERVLPLVQRIGVRINILFCVWCRYGRQVGFLRVAFRRFDRDRFEVPVQVLSPQARERIKRALGAAQN